MVANLHLTKQSFQFSGIIQPDVQLLKVLEMRKKMLQKEQGMLVEDIRNCGNESMRLANGLKLKRLKHV
ncbi:hypothetical protein RchiOBHm_Chr2g0123531 [Rosa chinensis]|uniref:Uncharacterized protein n=1 Tax=Rosa chinensis TaxID=74649 RepID=A0A2P6RT42_ROSCH|nr:hypothetical protein RchiOBHm_Chr2g0123531 [Rosa chinensis]